MGIPSLTKFIEDRSQHFCQNYELSNCSLIIDGHSICNKLYNWQYECWKVGFSPYCYGGDYDKYAETVKLFFQMLRKCNVIPYILFDGCNEDDKASLIRQRLNENAKTSSEITPTSDHHMYGIGAVGLRYAFRDVVAELQLKVYTCLSDANRQKACLARHLNCPVLSADSDFFVSSALFIPFSSVDCKINENESKKSINCRIYKIENLINYLGGRPAMHYLLPVLLGNNQFSTKIFSTFFRQAKIFGSRQKTVKLIFEWIKKQSSLETAIKKILESFARREQKCCHLKVIKNTIIGYTPVSVTPIMEHFDIQAKEDGDSNISLDFKKIEADLGLKIEEAVSKDIQVSEIFEKKIIECQYPAFFLDMMLKNRYYVWPNIEDCSKPDANSIGYDLMAAIHNILVQTDDKRLTVLRRNSKITLENFLLPSYEHSLPSIEEIDYLNLERRQDLIFKILEVNTDFCKLFECFPQEWHLFMLSLKYCVSKSQFNDSFIYSLIFCFLTLNYVDIKLNGFYRSAADLQDIQKVSPNSVDSVAKKNTFLAISQEDSIVFMQKIVKYFEEDSDDNADTYDRGIMHSIAEFQCVFLHLKYLNTLFCYPFKDTSISKVVDGTFIYNMAKNLRPETSLKNYLTIFLQECRSIYGAFVYVIELFCNHFIR